MCGWSALETATERPTRRCERSVGHFVNTVNTGYTGCRVAEYRQLVVLVVVQVFTVFTTASHHLQSTQARSTCHRRTVPRVSRARRPPGPRNAVVHAPAALACGISQRRGRAPGRGGRVHLLGAATGQLALLLSGA